MTEQEIIKKFEELGYEIKPKKNYPHMVYLVIDDEDTECVLTIYINKESRAYWKTYADNSFECFTLREHQLLTELFKCWGWIDEYGGGLMSKKEIIKKFKELGYQYKEYSDFETFIDNSNSVVIIIGADKTICKYKRDCYCSKKAIRLQEFKLLIELFKWKKWIE